MTYLHKRGYNRHFLRQEITRAKIITRNEALLPKSATTITTDKSECVPFILTCNPALRSISSTLRKHISILTSSHRCHNMFKSTPIVAFQRASNITNFLVRAKLRNPSQNSTPSEVLFNAAVIVLRAPRYPTGLLLTHSTPQMKQNPLLTTLPATQKNLFTWFSATLSQTIYRRYQQKSCTRGECVTADDILTSFVIYYRTDARQHVIYLLSRRPIKKLYNCDNSFMPESLGAPTRWPKSVQTLGTRLMVNKAGEQSLGFVRRIFRVSTCNTQ